MKKILALYVFYAILLIGVFDCWSFVFKTLTKKQNQYKSFTCNKNDGYRKCDYIKMSTEQEGGSPNVSQSVSRFNPLTSQRMLLEAQKLRVQAEEIERASTLNSTILKNKLAESNLNQTIEFDDVFSQLTQNGYKEQNASESTIPKSALSLKASEEASTQILIDEITGGKPVQDDIMPPPRVQVISVIDFVNTSKLENEEKVLVEENKDMLVVKVDDIPVVFSPEGIPLLDPLYSPYPWYSRWAIGLLVNDFLKKINKEKDNDRIFYEAAFLVEMINTMQMVQDEIAKRSMKNDIVDGKIISGSSDEKESIEDFESALTKSLSILTDQEKVTPRIIAIAQALKNGNTPEARAKYKKEKEEEGQSEGKSLDGLKSNIVDTSKELKLNISMDDWQDAQKSHKSIIKGMLRKNHQLSKKIDTNIMQKVKAGTFSLDNENDKLLASNLDAFDDFRRYALMILELPEDSDPDDVLDQEEGGEGEGITSKTKTSSTPTTSSSTNSSSTTSSTYSESIPSSPSPSLSSSFNTKHNTTFDKTDKSVEFDLVEFFDKMTEETESAKTLAEQMAVELFDDKSRKFGDGISREGGARFQAEILKESTNVTWNSE